MQRNPNHINNFKLLNNLWRYVPENRRIQFIISAFLMFIGGLLEVVSLSAVIPFIGILTSPERILDITIVAYLANLFSFKEPGDLVLPITIIFVSIAIISGLFRLFLLYITTRISYSTGHDLSVMVYKKTLHQPYTVHTSRNTSQIISAITIKVGGVVATFIILATLINSIILASMIIITLFVIDPFISSSILLSFTVFYLIASSISSKSLERNSMSIAIDQDKVVKNLQEGLGGIREVLLDNSQQFFAEFFSKSDKSLKFAQASNYVIGQSPKFVVEIIAICAISILAFFLSNTDDGLLNFLPVIVAMAVASQRLLPAVQQGYNAWASIVGSHSSLSDVLELLEQKDYKDLEDFAEPMDFKNKLTLKNVEFKYPDSSILVLEGIDIEFKKGEVIGIIGETGSGKSTLLDLIMGLLEPSKGSISSDDILINRANVANWKKNIAHVSQDVFLSDSSFLENIAFGFLKEDISKQKVIEAAKKSEIHDFIMTHELGYDHNIGEQGVKLSGGQRQRLGIARALFKGCNILALDESTSALDTETEQKVLKSIENIKSEVTIFMIAHRHSTLATANSIIELERGKISRQGTYQEIILNKNFK
mgnify:CR=1 FL=1